MRQNSFDVTKFQNDLNDDSSVINIYHSMFVGFKYLLIRFNI